MAIESVDTTTPTDSESAPAAAPTDEKALEGLVALLSGPNRKDRQNSAHTIALVAREEPRALVPHVDQLIEAIARPEAQTRWEVLDALSAVALVEPELVEGAMEGAEDALYDEESGMLRCTAFRFMSKLASTSPQRAARIWPLLDEALQCFHGDPEFAGMLDAVVDLIQNGKVDQATREAVAGRMAFDAQAGKSPLTSRAQRIVDLCKEEG